MGTRRSSYMAGMTDTGGRIRDAGMDIRQHLESVSPSAMSGIFKRLRLHGIIERIKGTYKYFVTAYGKKIIAAGLTVRNLVLNKWLKWEGCGGRLARFI